VSALPQAMPGALPAVSVAPVSIAVLGVGRIGRLHAQLLCHRLPGASVACVYDSHAPVAAAVGDELGVPVAASVEAVLADPAVEAVAICSSTDTHAALIGAAARAGKAIFCEKPIALDLAAVDAAVSAVETAGVACQIGFNRRFDPAHRSVRAAVAAGTVGEPHVVRITSRDPAPPPLDYVRVSGGLFLDMTIHDFDMARFVVGSEVVEVTAHGAVRIAPDYASVGDVDTAVITLLHENGCLTSIDNSRQAVYGYDQRVEVLGSKGMAASTNPPAHSGVVQTAAGSRGPALPFFFLDRYVPSYLHEWSAFLAAVRGAGPVEVGVRDGRAPLVIGLAAWRSLRERRTVRIEEIA
jgi:myo-inositol 2-dehydrogenase/D-chiro-inositol 1-dehydrogenase